MDTFYSSSSSSSIRSNIFLLVTAFIMVVEILLLIGFTNEKPLLSIVLAQELSEPVTNYSNISLSKSQSAENISIKQNDSKTVTASGHFANNQMKDGIVTWIQGGFWNLKIDNSSNTTKSAIFNANFTMIRPDGSLDHNHMLNNFTSTNVIFAGNDIVITGISDIYSNNGTEYEDVPITIHLMGKKVLGLMIDVNKTGGHFSGSNEMYGTLISGIGLDNSSSITNSIVNDRITAESNNITSVNSMAHTGH